MLGPEEYFKHMVQQKLVSSLMPYFFKLFRCLDDYDIRLPIYIEEDLQDSYESSIDFCYYINYNYPLYELFGFQYIFVDGEEEILLESINGFSYAIQSVLKKDIENFAKYIEYGNIRILYHPYMQHFERWVQANRSKFTLDYYMLYMSVKRKLSSMAPYADGLIVHPDGDGALFPLYFSDCFECNDALETEYSEDALFSGFVLFCLIAIARKRGYRPPYKRRIACG